MAWQEKSVFYVFLENYDDQDLLIYTARTETLPAGTVIESAASILLHQN